MCKISARFQLTACQCENLASECMCKQSKKGVDAFNASNIAEDASDDWLPH